VHTNNFTSECKNAPRIEQCAAIADWLRQLSRAFAAVANNPSSEDKLNAIEELLPMAAAGIRRLRGTACHDRAGLYTWIQSLCISATRWLHTVRRRSGYISTESIGAVNHIYLVHPRPPNQVYPEPTPAQLRFAGDLSIACKNVITDPTNPEVFAVFRGVLGRAPATLDDLRQEAKR
jgi:hypothetical protein